MSNKYSRYQSVISRNADESIGEDNWLKQLEKSFEKDAVQSRHAPDLYQQISEIMNGKSKHTSVDAAVKDMQERSGLLAYLNKINKQSDENPEQTKTASDDENDVINKKTPIESVKTVIIPIVIKKCPAVKDTIKNVISSGRGNLSLPAIIDRIRSIHQNDVSDTKDWDDDNLLAYVSRQNLEEKQKYPEVHNESNLGKQDSTSTDDLDASNNDAFFSLNPAK